MKTAPDPLDAALQLAYESYKARKIVRSRDIAFAYTNSMANDYYSVRDYDYFCFWCHVSESEKKKDIIIGFVFFTFKGRFDQDAIAFPL
jgi:hypothetical protein